MNIMKLIHYLYTCVVFVQACEQHKTCDACIRDNNACIWCDQEETLNEPRCISEQSLTPTWCTGGGGQIHNPASNQTISKQPESSPSSENIVQLTPERIKMYLRPGQSMKFNFSYKAIQHFPVDLYFLHHASMGTDLWATMDNMFEEVYGFLQRMTSNVFIGFGSFIDKNKVPFMSVNNSTLAYSFKHRFSLSNDFEMFKNAKDGVRINKSSYNDDPEGGLDALAQVLACDEIGWRKNSRKIVVFSTDKPYHAAGDGSPAGIINPYDGKCHMENGMYTKEQDMDYPSISMINKLASDREIIIIFVISIVKSSYDDLENTINGARVINHEPSYSQKASVTSELKRAYENIIREIYLKKNIKPESYSHHVDLSFDPACDKGCEVKQNTELKITGNIKVLEYFESNEIMVDISVQGIKEKLSLDIELIKDCQCKTVEGDMCNGNGIRRCGICECNPGRRGNNCECSSTNSSSYDRSGCIAPDGTSTLECNGRGSCICGTCICEERYKGRYCECDQESCPRDKNGQYCGHGRCVACTGDCECDPGWAKNTQSICYCENSTISCQTGPNECFNYGECKCNECKCPVTTCEWDARSSQDERCQPLPCVDCLNRQCHLLEPYAMATVIKSNTPCNLRVNVTSVQKLGNDISWTRCTDVRADVGCYTEFIYRYDHETYGVHVIVQSEYNCAESAYIYGGACLGTLVFVGILTLVVWKLVTVHRDRKEYKRFLKQYLESLEGAQPNYNVCYVEPHTTTTNPIFRRLSLW